MRLTIKLLSAPPLLAVLSFAALWLFSSWHAFALAQLSHALFMVSASASVISSIACALHGGWNWRSLNAIEKRIVALHSFLLVVVVAWLAIVLVALLQGGYPNKM
ncbi:MAG: hypothetical protein ACKN9T_11390 [Candidatus Methylumidiphilus sp.]